jgi:hypothetical protein
MIDNILIYKTGAPTMMVGAHAPIDPQGQSRVVQTEEGMFELMSGAGL